MADIQKALLEAVDAAAVNSEEFAQRSGIDHQAVVGRMKSLAYEECIALEQGSRKQYVLTEEGTAVAQNGSPEARVWAALPATMADLKSQFGDDWDKAKKQLMQQKHNGKPIIDMKSGPQVTQVEGAAFTDATQAALGDLGAVTEKDGKDLIRRKLLKQENITFFVATKGPNFSLDGPKKKATDLTTEMLASGAWKNEEFKAYNFNAKGKDIGAGNLHPLLRLRQELRESLVGLGFQEMETNNYVESSFWCFDTLFVPQQHPARDMQDTFFMKDPATCRDIPEDYLDLVKRTHSEGLYGSLGYKCPFSVPETQKNVLRTHTTACTARTLKKLADMKDFAPGKYFSIDRVFRNEAMDATHLCEFHQIEGFVIDKGLSLANMIYVLKEFFAVFGITDITLKPAFNPYTEPSMEILGYHDGLGKLIEVGNSGVFRPEMLEPMGFDKDVTAIAWGLSLERPAMMNFGLNNIHELFGPGCKLPWIKTKSHVRVDTFNS